MNEPATLEEIPGIRVPVLYMVGGRSPESSRSVAERLVAVLPGVRRVEFAELGHMGPVTNPTVVSEAIASSLAGGTPQREL
jgi:pimeloyl-ACP methyl ester carboxylesterase